MKRLFEAGAHFGHKTERWHPKMKKYIYGSKSGIYIIDLQQSLQKLKEAYDYVYKLSANGGKVLFVGTKFQVREIIAEEARQSNNFFVNLRWLGGMLTNFGTLKQSVGKLKKIEEMAGPDRNYEGILKKEAVRYEKSRQKLEAVIGGIRDLRKNPAAVFIIDIKRESIALKEAIKLGIPVIAVVDTNCDPRGVDFPIPGNDDSIHCVKIFANTIATAAIEGRKAYDMNLKESQKTVVKDQETKTKTGETSAVKKEEISSKDSEKKMKVVKKVTKKPEQTSTETDSAIVETKVAEKEKTAPAEKETTAPAKKTKKIDPPVEEVDSKAKA